MKRCLMVCVAIIATAFCGCSSQPNQTLSRNKAIVLRSEAELWSKGNLAAADELYSNDFICH
jgi:hypothetical protein